MPSPERVRAFLDRVVSGDHVGAIEDFYWEDATMQENGAPPRVGRALLMEQEARTLARQASVNTHPVEQFAIDGDTVFIRWVFEFTAKDGVVRRLEEVAVQTWRGDRIAAERFFYDPSQFA
jgi:ketosteroid isomerase-like protein